MIALALAAALACTVTDGDTIRCGDERIRIENIDAAETRCRCAYECRMADAATRRLEQLLRDGFELERRGLDRYGRTLARLWADGEDVGERMVDEGLARPWEGRRRSWCG